MSNPTHGMPRRMLLLAGALAPLAPALATETSVSSLALFGSSSGRVEGSGRVVDDERSLAGFSRVIVNGPIDVQVRPAD